jgi:hypothetical protein
LLHGHIEVTNEDMITWELGHNSVEELFGEVHLSVPPVNSVDVDLTEGVQPEGDSDVSSLGCHRRNGVHGVVHHSEMPPPGQDDPGRFPLLGRDPATRRSGMKTCCLELGGHVWPIIPGVFGLLQTKDVGMRAVLLNELPEIFLARDIA